MSAPATTPRRGVLGALLAAGMLPAALRAEIVHPSGYIAAVRGEAAARVRALLAQLPAASIGSGRITVVTFSSSLCPVCRAMDRKFPGTLPNIEARYIAAPMIDSELGAVLRVARDARFAVYKQFMAGAFRALPPPSTAGDRREIGQLLEVQEAISAIANAHSGNPAIAVGVPRQIMLMDKDAVFFARGQQFGIWQQLALT